MKALIPPAATIGSTLVSQLSAQGSALEETPANNTAQLSSTIENPYRYTASLTPTSADLRAGGKAIYTLQLKNTGIVNNTYSFSTTGLDSGWVTFTRRRLRWRLAAPKRLPSA
ncbi:MAG: hypothetical protein AB9888_00225 [Bacteroidales bacterium]